MTKEEQIRDNLAQALATHAATTSVAETTEFTKAMLQELQKIEYSQNDGGGGGGGQSAPEILKEAAA